MTMSIEGENHFEVPEIDPITAEKLFDILGFAIESRHRLIEARQDIASVVSDYNLQDRRQFILRSTSNNVVPAVHDIIKLGTKQGESRIGGVFSMKLRVPLHDMHVVQDSDNATKETTSNDVFTEVNYFNGPKERYLVNTFGAWRYETSEDLARFPGDNMGSYFYVLDSSRNEATDNPQIVDLMHDIADKYVPVPQTTSKNPA